MSGVPWASGQPDPQEADDRAPHRGEGGPHQASDVARGYRRPARARRLPGARRHRAHLRSTHR